MISSAFSGALTTTEINYTFEHQDPAGDVLKYNATENGTVVGGEPEIDALDLKWINSEEDGEGNIILTMDLKSKNKFINDDDTKYIFRIITDHENTTGFNITYEDQTTILIPFSIQGNGTTEDITTSVTFQRDKGDELMQITLSIAAYFQNITNFWLDAYSLRTTDNATYLDYISELPGHPEYVSPVVENEEGLDNNQDDTGDGTNNGSMFVLLLCIGSIIAALVVVVILVTVAKRQRQNQH